MANTTTLQSLIIQLLLLFGGFLILGHSLEEGIGSSHVEEERRHHTTTTTTLAQITSLLPSPHCTPSPSHKGKNSLKVVHRHGPCSPVRTTQTPTVGEILSQDQSRVRSIHSRLAGKTNLAFNSAKSSTLPAKSGSSLGSGNYLVTVGIGTPKKDISLNFDTGSDLTWTQCQPCVKSCYKQQEPIFDPTKSSSYSNISCNTPTCSLLTTGTGNKPDCTSSTCVYGVLYGDRSLSVGYFAKDKLTLSAHQVLDNFLFGCGQGNKGLFGQTAGLLGLGSGPVSIVSQTATNFGKFFSYCLPSKSSSNGYLTFGNNGVANSVKFTPLLKNPKGSSFYFIDVKGISVSGQKLSIPPMVFSNAGTIIDSGTVVTRLPATAYSALKEAFRQNMKQYPLTEVVSIFDTCYDLSNFTNFSVPKIGFTFAQNLEMDVPLIGIVVGVGDSKICLAFAGNSDDKNVGILGNIQQQTQAVVYDIAGGKLGIGPAGCM